MDVEGAPQTVGTTSAAPEAPLAVVHASTDRMWAEWIAEQFERAGVATCLMRYTSSPEHTLSSRIDDGLRRWSRLVVLFSAPFMLGISAGADEWADAIAHTRGHGDRVIAVLVGRCNLPAGFWQLEPVSFFGLAEARAARERLLRRSLPAAVTGTGRFSDPLDVGFVRYPGRAPELVSEQLPARNSQFTGRLEHLQRIRVGLTGNRVTLVPHTLHGLGGVGKTEIAVEYAHRFGADYDVVWWVRAESRATASASLAELGVRLGADPDASRGECIRHAHEALRRGVPYARWLLIFDNADDIAEALDLLPPSSDTGHVLITSRNPDWAMHGDSIAVEVLARRESVELLRRKAPGISIENADGFAEAVQDLPLALEHAASWYRETGGSASEYRELMEDQFRTLFAHMEFRPILTLGSDEGAEDGERITQNSGYIKTVASAWLIAAQTMADDARNPAIKLLEFVSVFAPVPVSVALMRSAPHGLLPRDLELHLQDKQSTSDMVRSIATRSLAKAYTPADGPSRTHALEMHRLVQLFVTNSMTPARLDAYRKAARMALAETAPDDPEAPRNYRAYVELIPHLQPTGALRSQEPEVRRLVLDTCRSLLRQGEYRSCLTLARRALPAWDQVLAPDDVDLLTLRRSESLALGGLGDQLSRLSINEEVLRLAVAAHGEDSDVALRARGSIAAASLWLGRVDEAEQAARAVLDSARGKYGQEHPRTLREKHNYAAHLRLAGRCEEALQLDREVYERRVEQYGERESRSVLDTRTSLARDLRELGLVYEAAQEQEDNYAACVALLGRNSPDTMRAMAELGAVRRAAGRYEEAHELGKLALERVAAQLGEDHPDYISALVNFSTDCRFVDELDRGRTLAREAYDKAREKIPAPNPIRAATATNLAVFLRIDDEPEHATRLDTEALDELRQTLGEGNHHTLACQLNLGHDLALSGDLQGAKRLHEDAWTRLSALRGPDHPQTWAARANLLLVLERLGEGAPQELDDLLASAEAGSPGRVGLTRRERETIAARRLLPFDLFLPMY